MKTFILLISLTLLFFASDVRADTQRTGHVKCIYKVDETYVRAEGCEEHDDEKSEMVFYTFQEYVAKKQGYQPHDITIKEVDFFVRDNYATDAALIVYQVPANVLNKRQQQQMKQNTRRHKK
jgi:hypothetical protein